MDTRRLILVFVFSFSLVMLWDAWQRYNNPPVPAQQAQTSANASVPVPSNTPAAAAVPASSASVPSNDAALPTEKAQIVHIKTDLFVADISTQGGDIVGLELSKYKSTEERKSPSRCLRPSTTTRPKVG